LRPPEASWPDRSDSGRPANLVVLWGLFLVATFATLCYGSTDRFFILLWLIALAPVTALAVWTADRHAVGVMLVPAAIAVCFALVAVLQSAVPPPVGTPHPLWAEASKIAGTTFPGQISIIRDSPMSALGSIFLCCAAIICGISIGSSGERSARLYLEAFAIFGTLYGLVAILWLFLLPDWLLWRQKTAYLDNLTGTFVNRNAAAAFFAMVLVTASRLLASRRTVARRRRTRFRTFVFTDRKSIIVIGQITVALVAMLLTGSRAGSILGLVFASLAFLLRSRSRRLNFPVSGLVLFALGALAASLMLLQTSSVGDRLNAAGLDSEGRLATYHSTAELILAHPLLGSGLGTFHSAFPPFRSDANITGVWDRAHSTILEIAADVGIPLAALVAGAWAIAIVFVAVGAAKSSSLALVAPLLIMLMGHTHSLFDFPLQIPGYAVWFCAIAGCGIGRAVCQKHESTFASD
jgi:O-antigen ligase